MSRTCNHAVSHIRDNQVLTFMVGEHECPHCLAIRVHELEAEIERLREALRQIITHQSLLTELADQTGASILARKALEGNES